MMPVSVKKHCLSPCLSPCSVPSGGGVKKLRRVAAPPLAWHTAVWALATGPPRLSWTEGLIT